VKNNTTFYNTRRAGFVWYIYIYIFRLPQNSASVCFISKNHQAVYIYIYTYLKRFFVSTIIRRHCWIITFTLRNFMYWPLSLLYVTKLVIYIWWFLYGWNRLMIPIRMKQTVVVFWGKTKNYITLYLYSIEHCLCFVNQKIKLYIYIWFLNCSVCLLKLSKKNLMNWWAMKFGGQIWFMIANFKITSNHIDCGFLYHTSRRFSYYIFLFI
jgi:hypothetical protein